MKEYVWGWFRRQAMLLVVLSMLIPVVSWGQARPGSFRMEPWMQAQPTSTGIDVGQKIPEFQAVDQFGKTQDFNSIRGPKGAAIFFSRSLDW